MVPRFLRIRFGLMALMAVVACFAGMLGGIRLWQYSDLNRDTRVFVALPDGTIRTLQKSITERRLFGRKINSERLVRIVESRNKSMRGKSVIGSAELTKGDWTTVYAAEFLGEVEHPQSLELLVALLNDPWEQMRRTAARALGELGDRRAVPYLRECLRNATDKKEREVVAFYLGKLGDLETSVPILIDCIDDDWPTTGRLEQIEEITGLSLKDKKVEWYSTRMDGRQYGEFISWLTEFRKSMHEWWADHMHGVSPKEY